MNIVHIAPNAPYNEGWGYQENLLPKYQARMGHDVTLIVTNLMHNDGVLIETECPDSFSKDGFRVIRRRQKKSRLPILDRVFTYIDIKDLLMDLKPDYVFYHGMISTTIAQVVSYKKEQNPKCIIVQDNHMDYRIGFNPSSSVRAWMKGRLYWCLYKMTNKYISRVYGVTPWRKSYAEKVFGVPNTKSDVLIMGADDDYVDLSNRKTIRDSIRQTYGVHDNEFLIVTGAKIDRNKKIELLMEAVNNLTSVKLIIFGEVLDDIKNDFNNQLSDCVKWVGWIDSKEVYKYFFAADLVFFPGQHSVLWEQACACKVPCVFAKWEGMDHVNNGGNAEFLEDISVASIENRIIELLFSDRYYCMHTVAESNATDIYFYSRIACKTIDDYNNLLSKANEGQV